MILADNACKNITNGRIKAGQNPPRVVALTEEEEEEWQN